MAKKEKKKKQGIADAPTQKNKTKKQLPSTQNTITTTATKKDPLDLLATFLWSIKAKNLPDVLHDLLTTKEIQEFAERIEILRQLNQGVTQRVIAKNLGISVTTVSRWSKVLQTGKEKIKKYL